MNYNRKWMSVAACLLLAGLIFAAGVAAQEATPVASPETGGNRRSSRTGCLVRGRSRGSCCLAVYRRAGFDR